MYGHELKSTTDCHPWSQLASSSVYTSFVEAEDDEFVCPPGIGSAHTVGEVLYKSGTPEFVPLYFQFVSGARGKND